VVGRGALNISPKFSPPQKQLEKNMTIHLPGNHTITKSVAENMGTVKILVSFYVQLMILLTNYNSLPSHILL
jgi:hypothetical protein